MQQNFIKEAIELRRYLHTNPELSCEEEQSSDYLKDLIRKNCDFHQLVEFENFGFAVIFEGSHVGKSVLIRADFDALPIQEVNDFAHKSTKPGISHKCGHDGHAAILYALSRKYSEEKPEKGKVILLFQPAEENGEGAKGIVNDPKFDEIKADYAVALHNMPGYPKHSIISRKGSFTAAANSLIIKLNGKTSHAAEPELGINPAAAMSQITLDILSANRPDLNADDFKIATPIYSLMGEKAYGVSAGYGELHFTLRAWNNDVMDSFDEECRAIALKNARNYGLEVEFSWTQSFYANVNNERVVDAINASAKRLELEIIERATPFKWGEDFGLFTERFSGAMFGIGAGEDNPALHNPDYDFPDEIIETGVNMFFNTTKNLL